MIRYAILVCAISFVAACSFRGFKPSPPDYYWWYPESMPVKDAKERIDDFYNRSDINNIRKTNLDVHKTMLECGYPDYVDQEQHALFQRCMLKSGYLYLGDRKTLCELPNASKGISACKLSLDEVPGRDINKRLHGKFCSHKVYSTYAVCQP